MTMQFSRYQEVRSRLIALHDLIQNRTYQVWIAPEKLMSLEQVRSRPVYTQEGFANDGDFYSEQQLRSYRIPQILGLLGNIQNAHDFGFQRATSTIVEIYDAIQEYISLWVEITKNAPEFETPPMKELRLLENFAYILFNEYKKIKPFKKLEENRIKFDQDSQYQDRSLAGFSALFGMTSMHARARNEEISFYSFLDELEPQSSAYSAPMWSPAAFDPFAPTSSRPSIQQDTLLTIDQHCAMNPNWIFQAG